jgi:hypothetical protein
VRGVEDSVLLEQVVNNCLLLPGGRAAQAHTGPSGSGPVALTIIEELHPAVEAADPLFRNQSQRQERSLPAWSRSLHDMLFGSEVCLRGLRTQHVGTVGQACVVSVRPRG